MVVAVIAALWEIVEGVAGQSAVGADLKMM